MVNLSYCAYLSLIALYKKKRALANTTQRLRRGTLPGARPGPAPRIRVPIEPTDQAITLFFTQCLFEAVIREQKRRLRSKKWSDKTRHLKAEYRRNLTPELRAREVASKNNWYKNNPDRFKQSCDRQKKKNPIVGLLRNRIFCCVARGYKSAATMELLGCSIEQLKTHLEQQFQPGMTWENRGGKNGWQIDHIRPCASFDLAQPDQQKQCFHFSNLQPLWAKDNLSKGDKYGNPGG